MGAMGLKQGAVLTRLHRARLKLRESVDGQDPPPPDTKE